MKLTTFSDYTLRVLMYLASERERLATIPEMAAAYEVSENHLMKVVHQLVRAGLVESVRGKGGGVRLAKAPDEIRLGRVVRTSEGVTPIVECLSPEPSTCKIAPICRLSAILVASFEGFYSKLDEHTLADLVTQSGELAEFFINKPASRKRAQDSPPVSL